MVKFEGVRGMEWFVGSLWQNRDEWVMELGNQVKQGKPVAIPGSHQLFNDFISLKELNLFLTT